MGNVRLLAATLPMVAVLLLGPLASSLSFSVEGNPVGKGGAAKQSEIAGYAGIPVNSEHLDVGDRIRTAARDAQNAAYGPTASAGWRSTEHIDQQLQAELVEYLQDGSGQYGVAIRNLATGQTVLINADKQFLSASTYKLLVMYRVYQEMERGTLGPGDWVTITSGDAVESDPMGDLYPGQTVTVADALEALITWSSNAAAYALTRTVGGWATLDYAAAQLGMSQTGFWDGYFWTTPEDMLIFLRELAEDRMISVDASRRMVGLLQRQTVNDRIPALLPAGVAVAHKTGDLPGVRNDVGIVYAPGASYVICVLSRWADEDEAVDTIAEVSRRTYNHYAGTGVAREPSGTVTEDGLRLRSSVWGTVVDTLPAGAAVRIDTRAQDSDGAYWYHVSTVWGAEGWVNGTYLSVASGS